MKKMFKKQNMKHIITRSYIDSIAYTEAMFKYVDNTCDPYYQERNVKNFNYRVAHLKGLGAWRWLSTYRHRNIIGDFIFSDKKGIDFGGNQAPIWGNTEIIDINPPHMYRKLNHTFTEELDYVFTSHTLEHIDDIHHTLCELFRILKRGGYIIVIVPSWTCKRWQAGQPGNTHKWTFSLDNSFVNIEIGVHVAGFKILQAEYTWDNSIFVLATKTPELEKGGIVVKPSIFYQCSSSAESKY